jgi:calcineurin-like phosphoesterase family protein
MQIKQGKLKGVQLIPERTFFTSDIHFNHENIIKYCDRPWSNATEMNEGIVSNWNSVVKNGANVFIVGDLAMGGPSKAPLLASYLRRLNGNKFLIPGNHDTWVLDDEKCLKELTVLPPLVEIAVPDQSLKKGRGGKRQRIVLCHYAMKVWNRSHHGTWMLYGHSHHTMPPDYTIKSFDVGLDGAGYDYKPLSYYQVKNLMSAHGQETVDHHDSNTY